VRVVNDMVVFPLDVRASGGVPLADLRYPPLHTARAEPGRPGMLAGEVGELAGDPLPDDIQLNDPHGFNAYLLPVFTDDRLCSRA
jgi:hypothetical protein